MTIQRTTGGGLLRVTTGAMAKECCCAAEPSSCPNEDPELYVSVFDADYAGGNLTWCGETWTQAEVQAGAEKGPVCPTTYVKGQFNIGNTAGSATVNHQWNYASGGGNRLNLQRLQVAVISYNATRTPKRYYYPLSGAWSNRIYVQSNPTLGYAFESFFGPFSFKPRPLNNVGTGTGGPTSITPTVKAPAQPRPNTHGSYLLPNSFTENSMVVSGIEYSWRRGNGW